MGEKAILNRKLREGECRTTKQGVKYCKRRGKVRFAKK